jgi:hypothetical protein
MDILHTYKQDVVVLPIIPTAEELSRYFFEKLEARLQTYPEWRAADVWLTKVTVYETPTSTATYLRPLIASVPLDPEASQFRHGTSIASADIGRENLHLHDYTTEQGR